MNAVKRSLRNYALILFVLVWAAFLLNGCGTSNEKLLKSPSESGKIRLDSAISDYESGDFQKAAEQFQLLWITTDDPRIKKAALHGLACARLVLAEKPEEFAAARQLWRQWRYTPGPGCPENQCFMYLPVMEKWFATGNCETFPSPTDAEKTSSDKENSVSPLIDPEVILPVEFDYAEAFAEAAAQNAELREMLEKREDEIRILRRQASKMEKALQVLKAQIVAIEEIHQEINEKKKGIQNP